MAGPGRPSSQTLKARAHGRAHSRARQRLVELHREEFRELLEVEKAREGIPTLRPREVAS